MASGGYLPIREVLVLYENSEIIKPKIMVFKSYQQSTIKILLHNCSLSQIQLIRHGFPQDSLGTAKQIGSKQGQGQCH